MSGLPESAEHEAHRGDDQQGGHRLVLDRLVDRALDVAGNLLDLLAGLAATIRKLANGRLGSLDNLADLLPGLVRKIGSGVSSVGADGARLVMVIVVRSVCHVGDPHVAVDCECLQVR